MPSEENTSFDSVLNHRSEFSQKQRAPNEQKQIGEDINPINVDIDSSITASNGKQPKMLKYITQKSHDVFYTAPPEFNDSLHDPTEMFKSHPGLENRQKLRDEFKKNYEEKKEKEKAHFNDILKGKKK